MKFKINPVKLEIVNTMNPVFFSDRLPSLKKVFLSAGHKRDKALLICDRKFQNHLFVKILAEK